jgi:hypothetical protein
MKDEEEEKKEPQQFEAEIPACCLEGWKDCPHVAKKQKKLKTNIGL